MGWLTSWVHFSDDGSDSGKSWWHTDTYHVDESGKRDRPHHEDLKVSGPKFKPSMQDVREWTPREDGEAMPNE